MLKTRLCELLGIEHPIVSAGMGGVAAADLAAAVSEAGGLGTLGLAAFGREGIQTEISAARAKTQKPLAANLLVPFLRPGTVEQVLQMPLQVLTFFWGDPNDHAAAIRAAHDASIKVIWQCGSAEEAQRAKNAGVDIVMAQGFEAGGHVRGTTTTIALIPAVRDAIGDLPLIASGGIADGRGLAAALALGADGAAIGTRFLASTEAAAHPAYKDRVLAAKGDDTFHTTLYDIGWPEAAHRVIRTKLVERWEAAGRPVSGSRPGEGDVVVRSNRTEVELPPVNYSVAPPLDCLEGDVEGLAFYAGQSCSLVREILPAAEIVRRIVAEAEAVIGERLASFVR